MAELFGALSFLRVTIIGIRRCLALLNLGAPITIYPNPDSPHIQIFLRLECLPHGDQEIVDLKTLLPRTGALYVWAIVAAGGVPCMSTQFSKDVDHRERHIRSLQELLQYPLIITTEALMLDFPNLPRLRILTTTDIDNISTLNESSTTNLDLAKHSLPGFSKQAEDLAVLLLTSGSTGEAKAVSLTHLQILSSIIGKIKIHGTTPQDTFLA
ncbi:hypothetical protein IFR05_011665 [Cadophora sp. M221]|nr:hypothetical protein IFR05_011665 [Cadophora sp. M221]